MKQTTLALIVRNDKILIGWKQGGPEIGEDTYNGPGGKRESDESLVECLVRETFEEFSIVLNPAALEKVAVITFYAGNVPYQEMHVYYTSEFTGEPKETESMRKPVWFPVDNLPFEHMLEADPYFLPQLIAGKKFNANVYYKEKAKGYIDRDFLPFAP